VDVRYFFSSSTPVSSTPWGAKCGMSCSANSSMFRFAQFTPSSVTHT
jgi:hypothetical protein